MKTLKTLMVVMLIMLVTLLVVQPADARGGGGRGGGHGGRHSGGHGRAGWGHHGGYAHGHGYYGGYGYGWWGSPYWWGYPYWWDYPFSSYYNPYYDPYYYWGYEEPAVPPEGVTPPTASGQQQPAYWHFCQDPEGYYPYVKDCLGGWLTVVPPKPDAPPPASLGPPALPVSPAGKEPEK